MAAQLSNRVVLLVSCLDVRGIVAEVSHFIADHNGNIIDSDQYCDHQAKSFFMRIEFDISASSIPKTALTEAFRPIAQKYGMNWRFEFPDVQKRMAIFVSKYDHCLYDLILRKQAGEISAQISLIISNHPDLQAVADYFAIPFQIVPTGENNTEMVEAKHLELLNDYQIDLVVLARYMRIISPGLCQVYKNRIINIHHSFLPAFMGAKPYHQAYRHGVKIIGATSHYVTDQLDQGPIIEQDVVRISHKDTIADLVGKGRNLERQVLSKAVRLHLEQRVLPFGNKTIVFA